jgi:hypothetical protein
MEARKESVERSAVIKANSSIDEVEWHAISSVESDWMKLIPDSSG